MFESLRLFRSCLELGRMGEYFRGASFECAFTVHCKSMPGPNTRKFNAYTQCGNYGNLLSRILTKKIRESNVYTKEVSKVLISRHIFSVRVNFSFFHTVGDNSITIALNENPITFIQAGSPDKEIPKCDTSELPDSCIPKYIAS